MDNEHIKATLKSGAAGCAAGAVGALISSRNPFAALAACGIGANFAMLTETYNHPAPEGGQLTSPQTPSTVKAEDKCKENSK